MCEPHYWETGQDDRKASLASNNTDISGSSIMSMSTDTLVTKTATMDRDAIVVFVSGQIQGFVKPMGVLVITDTITDAYSSI